jgi:hypothetical protein
MNNYRLLSWSILIACSLIDTISANEDDGSDDGIVLSSISILTADGMIL